jgi:hypothetical protein
VTKLPSQGCPLRSQMASHLDGLESRFEQSIADIMGQMHKALKPLTHRSSVSRVSPAARALFIVGQPIDVTRSPMDFPQAPSSA